MKDQELLEKAVVSLTIENMKLKLQIESVTADKDLFWKWYAEKRDLLEKAELGDLVKNNKEAKK